MRYCPNDRCPRHLRAEELGDDVTACPFCLSPLVVAPHAPGADAKAEPAAWARPAAITAAAVAGAVALHQLPLPFVDTYAVRYGGSVDLSPGTLGVVPVASAFLLVEVASVLTAKGRADRETPAGRAVMARRAWGLSAVLAVVQTGSLWLYLRGVPELFERHASLDADPSRLALVACVAILAGFAATVALARAVDRRGLGSGLAVLQGITLASALPSALASPPGDEALPARSAALVLLAGAVAAGTAAVLRRRYAVVRAGEVSVAAGYREAARGARADVLSMRAPLGGVVPVSLAVATFDQLRTFAGLDALPSARTDPSERVLVLGGAACALAVALARWFNDPRRVASIAGGFGDARPVGEREADAWAVWRAGMRSTLAHTGGLAAATVLALRFSSPLDVVAIATLTALALDLAAELRLRRARGPLVALSTEARVAAADAACARLALAGVPAVVRNGNLRALLHWFAPHLALEVLVPAGDVSRARDALGAARA
ncbi:MAG: hypothetical protein U0324_06120 [Polyangiales bacterium]